MLFASILTEFKAPGPSVEAYVLESLEILIMRCHSVSTVCRIMQYLDITFSDASSRERPSRRNSRPV
jgi:hypothetical protein